MNETLMGVLVGGLIAIATAAVTLLFQQRQWKKSKKIELLRARRQELLRIFHNIMKHEAFTAEPLTDAYHLCPDNVRDAYDEFRRLGDMSDDRMSHEIGIQTEMKKALSQLDHEIEKELS